MREVHKAPFFILLLPFMAGILYVLKEAPVSYAFIKLSCIFFFMAFLFSVLTASIIPYSYRWISGFLLTVCCFFLGCWVALNADTSREKNFFSPGENIPALLVRLESGPDYKAKTIKYLASIEGEYSTAGFQKKSGKTLLYLRRDENHQVPLQYEKLIIHAQLKQISLPRNPADFDYRRYMVLQGVHYSAFVGNADWAPAGKYHEGPFWQLIGEIKEKMLTMADQGIAGKDERAVFKALLLGEKNELEPQLRASFAGTGTMHVLAVSGLHVGIIMLILNWALGFMNFWRYGRQIKVAVIILILWTYAGLTGFSPSVTRAVVMFSIVAFGGLFGRLTNIYNTLAVAAFLLLLYDPRWLLNVGFQLSFIAVFGIVWIQPKIYNWIKKPRWKASDYLWQIMSTTLAAQLITFPIGIFYFHQFPNLFLPTNLIVLPYVFGLMFIGCGFFVVNALGLLFNLHQLVDGYNILTTKAFKFLNFVVSWFEHLPYSAIQGIYIDLFECLLLYTLIAFLIFALLQRKRNYVWYGVSGLFLLIAYHSALAFKKQNENVLTFHSVPKKTLISIKEADKLYLVGDTAFLNDKNALQYNVAPYAGEMGISEKNYLRYAPSDTFHTASFFYKPPYAQAGAKRFIVISSSKEFENMPEGDNINYEFVVLSGTPKLSLDHLRQKLKFKTLILSADNKGYACKQWIEECRLENIPCYNLYDHQSYLVKI